MLGSMERVEVEDEVSGDGQPPGADATSIFVKSQFMMLMPAEQGGS